MNFFNKELRNHVFKKTTPVLIGYFFLGIGFGILLEECGYGPFEALLMSVFIYSGSMQYAAISLFKTKASLLTAFMTTLVVNARYFFYSLSMVDKYKNIKKAKPYMIHAIVDEAYALINENDHPDTISDEDYWLSVNICDHLYWIISTIIGVLIGKAINIEIKGVDFVMTALFVVLYVDQWLKNKDHIPSIAGIVIPLISLFIFGTDHFLIISIIILSMLSAFYEGDKT